MYKFEFVYVDEAYGHLRANHGVNLTLVGIGYVNILGNGETVLDDWLGIASRTNGTWTDLTTLGRMTADYLARRKFLDDERRRTPKKYVVCRQIGRFIQEELAYSIERKISHYEKFERLRKRLLLVNGKGVDGGMKDHYKKKQRVGELLVPIMGKMELPEETVHVVKDLGKVINLKTLSEVDSRYVPAKA